MTDHTPCLSGDLRTPGKRRAAGALTARRALTATVGSYPSPNYSSRNGTKVSGIVIHTAEGPTDADALGAFFAEPSSQVSSHAGCDDTKRVDYVDPVYEAWTLRSGNPWTDNLEMCGFAAWTRAQWLAHMGMIGQAARWVAERCHARGVPPQRITADDIRAGRRSGYFAHWDYTLGTGDGTHWDVGSNFPWDLFGPLVLAAYSGTPAPVQSPVEDDDMQTYSTADTKRGYVSTAYEMWWEGDGETFATYKQVTGGSPRVINQRQADVLAASLGKRRAALIGDVAKAVAGAMDPKALAAALAADLPPASGVSEADIETALRNVLGGLDNPPA